MESVAQADFMGQNEVTGGITFGSAQIVSSLCPLTSSVSQTLALSVNGMANDGTQEKLRMFPFHLHPDRA